MWTFILFLKREEFIAEIIDNGKKYLFWYATMYMFCIHTSVYIACARIYLYNLVTVMYSLVFL